MISTRNNFAAIFSLLVLFAVCGAAFAAGIPPEVIHMNEFSNSLGERIDGWRAKKGEQPRAVNPAYNVSKWKPINSGFKWKNPTVWMRASFTVPEEHRGKAVFLYLVVRDAAVVYIDGEQKFSISKIGSGLITKSADPNHEYTVALRVMNTSGEGEFIFAGYKVLESNRLIVIKDMIQKLSEFTDVSNKKYNEWRFSAESGIKSADPGTDISGWKNIYIKHNLGEGNTFGWYRSIIEVPEKINGYPVAGGPLFLEIEAQKDAELYVNGEKTGRFSGKGVLGLPKTAVPGVSAVIAIKVADLSGEGGLKSVQLHASALEPIQKNAVELIRLLKIVQMFYQQMPDPPSRIDDAIRNAGAEIDMILKMSDPAELSAGLDKHRAAISACETFLADYPLFNKGPYLQNVTQNSITIMWETLVPAPSTVYYGKSYVDQHSVSDPEPKKVHEITISGLETETIYKYCAVSRNLASPVSTFKTAIRRDTPFKVTVWGDSRSDPTSHESVVNSMILEKPDIAVNVGDVVLRGHIYDLWSDEYFTPIRRFAINTPTYIAIGNHEFGGYSYGGNVPWFDLFVSHPAPNDYYYSFMYGNTFFMALNPHEEPGSHQIRPGSDQYNWMVAQLESEEYKNAAFRLIFLHEPPYSECWTSGYYDGEPELRRDFVPLMEKYKMDIVFAGHTHDYERGQWPKPDGPYYIITGGGGASLDDTHHKDWEQIDIYKFIYHHVLLTIDGNHLKFEAIDRNNKVFDSFEIKR